MAYRLGYSDYLPPAAPPAPAVVPPTPESIPGGPSFIGLPQPPDVPCDPTGDGWRGPPGPPAPTNVYLPLAGGTMAGALLLRGDPAASLEAASKHYVDQQTAVGTPPGGPFLPLAGGIVSGPTTFTASPLTIGSNTTANTILAINGTTATQRRIEISTAGSLRWRVGANATPEGSGVSMTGVDMGSDFYINAFHDVGGATAALTLTRADQQLRLTKLRLGGAATITFQPVPVGTLGYDQCPFAINYNYTGSTAADNAWRYLNVINFVTDTVDVGAAQQAIGIGVGHNFGGGTFTGSRSGFRYALTQTAACPANGNYQAGLFAAQGSFSSGGTDLWANSAGIMFGGAMYSSVTPGATNWRGVTGCEIDYGINGTATAAGISGLSIIRWAAHTFQPAIWESDNALVISSQVGAVGAKFGIQIFGTEFPLDRTNGRVMGAGYPVNWNTTNLLQAAHGIDFYNLNLLGTQFRGRGFSVLGSGGSLAAGAVQVGGGYLSSSGATVSLDTAGSVCIAAVIHAGGGGANLIVNTALIHDATGTLANVTTVVGGVATAITLIPNTGRALTSAIPANPVTFRVSASPASFPGDPTTTPVQLDLTWTASNTLALQPSGGAVQVGTGCIAANGSVATVLGSLGPVGSHTAVQEWIAIKNGSGVTRYIPAF